MEGFNGMTDYTRIPIRPEEHKRLVLLQSQLTGKIDSYLTRPSLSDVIKYLLDQQEIKTMTSNTVTNSNGKQIDFTAAVNLMDDEIREELHNQQKWDSEQQFFTAYEAAHASKYGEEWELSKSNPVW